MRSLIGSLFQGLHFKIAAGVIVTVLLLSAVYLAWDYRVFREQLYLELEDSARKISAISLHTVVQLAMLGEHPELLQDAVVQLVEDTAVDRIHILDEEGVVRFSSEPSSLRRSLSKEGPGCVSCHRGGQVEQRSAFVELSKERILRHAEGIPNRAPCQPCHGRERDLTGVLIVDFSTQGVREKLAAHRRERVVRASITLAAILLVLGLLMHRLVIDRIRRLTSAVSALKAGEDFAPVLTVRGEDEIGQLADSFRRLAERLRRYYRELGQKERARISLVERLVETQEEERKSLSRELHDELGQSLSALLLSFRTHFRDADSSPPEAAVIEDFEERIRKLIDDIHQLAWQMRPPVLDDYGLGLALEGYVEELSKSTGLRIDFQEISAGNDRGRSRFPGWIEVTLYRIAQEALANVIRHADASRASVVLVTREGSVRLLIEDDGRGFDSNRMRTDSRHGLGLIGMQERVAQCGGTLDIESERMRGTTIRVKIPLVEEEKRDGD